jgi:hypothetical protein
MVDAWATADDVQLYTGVEVGDGELVRAQDIIEIFCGVTYDVAELSARNLRLLNRAVAYQAAWATYHPDLYLNVDVDNISQDGASHTPAHESAALLAPLARRCLARLTWSQKPLRVRRAYGVHDYEDAGPRDSAAADDARVWTPL